MPKCKTFTQNRFLKVIKMPSFFIKTAQQSTIKKFQINKIVGSETSIKYNRCLQAQSIIKKN